MQIGVSREEFEVHLQSVKHQRNKHVRDLSSLSSSAETVFSAPSVSPETNDDFHDGEPKCDENHNGLSSAKNDYDEDSLPTTFDQHDCIPVAHASRRDETTKNVAIDSLFSMSNCTERILEESVAFIETNIPFADPVISGILQNIQSFASILHVKRPQQYIFHLSLNGRQSGLSIAGSQIAFEFNIKQLSRVFQFSD